ncbi:peptidyl-prolyl cis-trans isomerase FKBP53-like [Diospyros lotus]|uniref:peptidyl-prolyl cis-trans isomerase FKBP53-like n=1 Tax=Diospyros lotus TaxID=55363 RepID=UPI002257CE93|nr:peptidyl-prolyl cis-trans isomerase FKBP53-like [Diospyros lotus]
MAFWGVEVKPGRPYTHRLDHERGRLRLSQATLGNGSSTKKSILQCNVGDKRPIYLCSLLPEKFETCPLHLEFEEEDEVIFSVIGPHSIHLSGFFYGDTQDGTRDDHGSDSYEEDIAETETDESSDYDSEDAYEDDFIFDDDMEMYSPSPVRNSGVVIEEIVDNEKPADQNGMSKQGKKKSNTSDDNGKSGQQIVVHRDTGLQVLESEDEDGFPISSSHGNKAGDMSNQGQAEENKEKRTDVQAKEKEKDVPVPQKRKRKVDDIVQDNEQARETGQQFNSSSANAEVVSGTDFKQKKEKKKKKKKGKAKEEKTEAVAGSGNTNQSEAANLEVEEVPPVGNESSQKSNIEINNVDTDSIAEGKKKKKNKGKKQGSESVGIGDQTVADKNGSSNVVEKMEAKPYQVRTFPNGLVIEEVAMGKPDGKKACPGKKVGVHYIGKLKKSGKIFDSNIGRAPFKFRLGIGQVIKGWDIGVNGMRVGDKRRLTIPPAMGYGSQGAGQAIPPNSWLVFDVELVNVQ